MIYMVCIHEVPVAWPVRSCFLLGFDERDQALHRKISSVSEAMSDFFISTPTGPNVSSFMWGRCCQ
jgi:hypothetical protein